MYIVNISLKVITVSAAATTFISMCVYISSYRTVFSNSLYYIALHCIYTLLYAYNILNCITTIARVVPARIINA